MRKSIFNLVNTKTCDESIKNFTTSTLLNNVDITETDTHVIIKNFPSAFGDMQNKNNRVYDWQSLVYAANWFNEVIIDNPYFKYIFDGHKDDDSYEFLAGSIINLRVEPKYKCIMLDLKINKGCKSQPTLKNILKDGDPIGISMRILSPNSMYVSKSDLQQLNSDITFLEDDNKAIALLMSKDAEIEYISGEAYIQRFDLTWFPSFNDSYIAEKVKLKGESTNISKLSDTSTNIIKMYSPNYCSTNSCKFRGMVKDFVDTMHKSESISLIKNNVDLYNDMLQFSYINLSEFEFDKIADSKYLSVKLLDLNLHISSVYTQNKTLKGIMGDINILHYILENKIIHADVYNRMLTNTLNKLIDEDNIFYQLVTINYLHWMLLSSIILTNKLDITVTNTNDIYDRLESCMSDNGDNDPNIDIKAELIKGINGDVSIYKYTNEMFAYIYKYINRYSDMQSPITIINESLLQLANTKKMRSLVSKKFIK